MGVALWLLCGLAVFVATRAIAAGRTPNFAGELFVAVAISFIAGLTASALDFGGWGEVDWRAGVFVICATFAATGALRLVRLFRRSATQS